LAVRSAHRITSTPPSILTQAREIASAKDLFRLLFEREIQVRYKQTALGVAWVILQPLVPALIFAAVLGSFARLPSAGTPYLLFALAGLVVFGLVSNTASRAGLAFLRDGALVSKVYFPRAILPLAVGSAALVDFIVGMAVLLLLVLGAGTALTIAGLVIPLVAVASLVLGLSLGLMLSALSAHFRDFAIAIPFGFQVLLYASPVLYSAELVPENVRTLYALNPMVAITETFQWALLGAPVPPVTDLALGSLVGATICAISMAIFHRASQDIPDVI